MKRPPSQAENQTEMVEDSSAREETQSAPSLRERGSSEFVVISVEGNDVLSSSRTRERNRGRRRQQANKRLNSLRKPGKKMAIFYVAIALTLIGTTIAGYVEALAHVSNSVSSSPVSPTPETASSQVDMAIADLPSHDGTIPSGNSTSSSNSKAIVHGLFIAALLLEVIGLWQAIKRLGRAYLYSEQQSPTFDPSIPVELDETQQVVEMTSPSSSHRLTRLIFGNPPKASPPPVLPSYEASLRQAARQAARRRAAEAGVTAGRRGREQIGTGDPEDLEVERNLRIGHLPAYKSVEMRNDKVLQRGERPVRRPSIASLFSTTGSERDSLQPSSLPAARFGSLTDLMRRLSDRMSLSGLPNPPSEEGTLTEGATTDKENEPDHLENKIPHSTPPTARRRSRSYRARQVTEKDIVMEELGSGLPSVPLSTVDERDNGGRDGDIVL